MTSFFLALHDLWRRRLKVAIGLPLAALVVLAMDYHVGLGFPPRLESRQAQVGLASTKVLVDSPVSQVGDVGENTGKVGTATDLRGLMARAESMASLLSTSPLKDEIGKKAGIPRDHLVVLAPTGFGPLLATPDAPDKAPDDSRVSILDLSVDGNLPIVAMNVRAPDEKLAARLAGATVDVLTSYLDETARAGAVPMDRRLKASRLGPVTSEVVAVGPRRLYAAAIFLVLLLLWTVTIAALPRLGEYWRELSGPDASPPVADADGPAAESQDQATASPPVVWH